MIVRRPGGHLHRRRRRGISIIEMTVMITGLAAMLGLCVSMLQLLMRLDGEGRARIDGAVALSRLAERFRRDVHLADSAAAGSPAGGNGPQLHLGLAPDRVIDYEVGKDGEAGQVRRIERWKGSVVRRESYNVPSRSPVRLTVREDGPLRFAVVAVDRRTIGLPGDPPRPFEIVAVVGKDHDRLRLAVTPKTGGGTR